MQFEQSQVFQADLNAKSIIPDNSNYQEWYLAWLYADKATARYIASSSTSAVRKKAVIHVMNKLGSQHQLSASPILNFHPHCLTPSQSQTHHRLRSLTTSVSKAKNCILLTSVN